MNKNNSKTIKLDAKSLTLAEIVSHIREAFADPEPTDVELFTLATGAKLVAGRNKYLHGAAFVVVGKNEQGVAGRYGIHGTVHVTRNDIDTARKIAEEYVTKWNITAA